VLAVDAVISPEIDQHGLAAQLGHVRPAVDPVVDAGEFRRGARRLGAGMGHAGQGECGGGGEDADDRFHIRVLSGSATWNTSITIITINNFDPSLAPPIRVFKYDNDYRNNYFRERQ
jgi:hypothetical protein